MCVNLFIYFCIETEEEINDDIQSKRITVPYLNDSTFEDMNVDDTNKEKQQQAMKRTRSVHIN